MEATDLSGLPMIVSSGIGAFVAVMATVQSWRAMQKTETTQAVVLQGQVEFQRTRAENAEMRAETAFSEARQDRERLNQLISDQSDMKAQNATMIEQMRALREENAELKAQIQNFMRLRDVGTA